MIAVFLCFAHEQFQLVLVEFSLNWGVRGTPTTSLARNCVEKLRIGVRFGPIFAQTVVIHSA